MGVEGLRDERGASVNGGFSVWYVEGKKSTQDAQDVLDGLR
jgi:hypothetical protein